MTSADVETWHERNAGYLSAALAWVRARLMFASGDEGAPSPAEVEQAEWAMKQAEAVDPPPALVTLSDRLGLSPFERHVLLLCAAVELDTRVARLCAAVQHDGGRAYPTFALAFSLFDEPSWEALSAEGPLRYFGVIDLVQGQTQPLTAAALHLDEPILHHLKGLRVRDERLASLLVHVDMGRAGPLAPSQQVMIDRVVQSVAAHSAAGQNGQPAARPLPVLQLVGGDGVLAGAVAARICSDLGLAPVAIAAEGLPPVGRELELLGRLLHREALLSRTGYVIEGHRLGREQDRATVASVRRLCAMLPGLRLLTIEEPWRDLDGSTPTVHEVKHATAEEQQAEWSATLGSGGEQLGAVFAGQFNLPIATIRELAARAPNGATGPVPARSPSASAVALDAQGRGLWEACRRATRPRFEGLAQRIVTTASWEDLVLPAAETAILQRIVQQIQQRQRVYHDWGFADRHALGLGISALFAGPSGTGKTLAAQVIATELMLDLYRIDLSAVVDKYVGNTEKNLRRLFDAAEEGGAILFFDEADALFGKRSEVKDAHDRYANIEVDYLLQRMESFRGLAILATNAKNAMDTAFMRRLRFVVNFPFPAPAERARIWQRVFPASVPRATLEWDRLGALDLSGGNIFTVAVNAAFSAAHAGKSVDMPSILDAARMEMRKLQIPFSEAALKWKEQANA